MSAERIPQEINLRNNYITRINCIMKYPTFFSTPAKTVRTIHEPSKNWMAEQVMKN